MKRRRHHRGVTKPRTRRDRDRDRELEREWAVWKLLRRLMEGRR